MGLHALKILERRRETAPDSEKAVFCLRLACTELYAPGDWLMVQPVNPPQTVTDVLKALALTGAERVNLRRHGEVTVQEALHEHLEITQLDPAMLNRLQRKAGIGDWPDRQAMVDYAWHRDLLDLLCDYPEARALGVKLIDFLSPLAPRYYSIASAPCATPGEVHILFKHVVHTVCGREHPGAATTLLRNAPVGSFIQGRIQPNKGFKLPPDGNAPIVMIGAGVGLAPFMGFMQARLCERAQGENWLFFGETHAKQTFLCRDVLKEWVEQGALHLVTAFSRDQAEKVYVQHRVLEHAETVRRLCNAGAYFYLCGDKRGMAPAVLAALEQVLGGDKMAQLKAENRLQSDIY